MHIFYIPHPFNNIEDTLPYQVMIIGYNYGNLPFDHLNSEVHKKLTGNEWPESDDKDQQ